MAKIKITNATGTVEELTLLSAFKAEGNNYIIFDSEKLGSMGLPIIYISKLTEKLEKIVDPNEWQNVKNYLKGIINGTSFEYIKVADNITSDEAFYTPLTLPVASFETIKSRYVVAEVQVEESSIPIVEPLVNNTPSEMSNSNVVNNTGESLNPLVEPVTPIVNSMDNMESPTPTVTPIPSEVVSNPTIEPIPNVNIMPNIAAEPVNPPVPESIKPLEIKEDANKALVSQQTASSVSLETSINFDNDKETFLKACENMFDALISKYQKEIADLEQRKQELARKEQEINNRMQSANEHLANAEAREQVANIAHDNAQKVMDISSIMPSNDNITNPAGVI